MKAASRAELTPSCCGSWTSAGALKTTVSKHPSSCSLRALCALKLGCHPEQCSWEEVVEWLDSPLGAEGGARIAGGERKAARNRKPPMVSRLPQDAAEAGLVASLRALGYDKQRFGTLNREFELLAPGKNFSTSNAQRFFAILHFLARNLDLEGLPDLPKSWATAQRTAFFKVLKPFLDGLAKKQMLRRVPEYSVLLTARGPVVTGFLLEFAVCTVRLLEEQRPNVKGAAQRPRVLSLHNDQLGSAVEALPPASRTFLKAGTVCKRASPSEDPFVDRCNTELSKYDSSKEQLERDLAILSGNAEEEALAQGAPLLPLTAPLTDWEAGGGSTVGAASATANKLLSEAEAQEWLQGHASDRRKALEAAEGLAFKAGLIHVIEAQLGPSATAEERQTIPPGASQHLQLLAHMMRQVDVPPHSEESLLVGDQEEDPRSGDMSSTLPSPSLGSHKATMISDKQRNAALHTALAGAVASYEEQRRFLSSRAETLDSELQALPQEADAALGGACSAAHHGLRLDIDAIGAQLERIMGWQPPAHREIPAEEDPAAPWKDWLREMDGRAEALHSSWKQEMDEKIRHAAELLEPVSLYRYYPGQAALAPGMPQHFGVRAQGYSF